MKEVHFRFMILFDVMHKIAHNSNNECSELNWKHVNWCENKKLSTIFALIFAHWNSSEFRNELFHWKFCVIIFCSLTLFRKIIIQSKTWVKEYRYNSSHEKQYLMYHFWSKSYFMLYVMICIYHLYFNVFLLFICFLRIFVTIKSMTNDKKGTWFVISNLK